MLVETFAQTNAQLVDLLKEKYSNINNFHAEFNGFFSSTSNNSRNLSGNIYFQKENQLRIETDRRLIISDGKNTWTFDKKLNRVVISLSKEEYKQFSPAYYLNEIVKESNIQLVEKIEQSIKIKLRPSGTFKNFEYAELWIDNNFIFKKVKAKDNSGILFELNLSNVILNSRIDESLFVFVAPENAKIIDLR
jgi:outer membrane lipoprotein-sorting protein